MRLLASVLVLAGSLFCASPAAAVVIYENGQPDGFNARASDLGTETHILPPIVIGDDFTLDFTAPIDRVYWWGVYGWAGSPGGDDFTIGFYDFSGDVPATDPIITFHIGDVGRTDTGMAIVLGDAYPIYAYDVKFSEFELGPGRYLLSVWNDTTGDDDDWFWASSDEFGDLIKRPSLSDPWTVGSGFELAFTLVYAPEPSSLLLLAGSGVLALMRRR